MLLLQPPAKRIKLLPTGTGVCAGAGQGSQVAGKQGRECYRWVGTLPATGRARRGQQGGPEGSWLSGVAGSAPIS